MAANHTMTRRAKVKASKYCAQSIYFEFTARRVVGNADEREREQTIEISAPLCQCSSTPVVRSARPVYLSSLAYFGANDNNGAHTTTRLQLQPLDGYVYNGPHDLVYGYLPLPQQS